MTKNNPLSTAIQQAEGATDYLGGLFAKIGNSEHIRGYVPTAYRNARRAMKTALNEKSRNIAVAEVTRQLRTTIQANANQVLSQSIGYGLNYAHGQLSAYNIAPDQAGSLDLSSQLESGSSAIMAVVEKQARDIQAVLSVGMDTDLILGDDEHIGILRPGDVISAFTFWTAGLLWSAFELYILSFLNNPYYRNRVKKIVVSAIDGRTTNCCLVAHGQVQPFDKPFHLTGYPRFADYLDWSPFHHRCRTSVALYFDDFDDGLSDEMRSEAQVELGKR